MKTESELDLAQRKELRDQFIKKSKSMSLNPQFRSAVKEFNVNEKFVIAVGQSSVVLCDSIFGQNYGHVFLSKNAESIKHQY